MSVTPASLRVLLPEFSDIAAYPDAAINAFLPIATSLVNAGRWGDLADYGVTLVVAHRLTLSAKAQRDAQFGKAPGQSTGILNNKSIDGVSAGYDASSVTEKDAGHWNLTVYGTEYIRLLRQMGAGPVQVAGEPDPNVSSVGAWSGPYFW